MILQFPVLLLGEIRIFEKKFFSSGICFLQQCCVLKNVSNFKIKHPALPYTEQISRSAETEIFICNIKTIIGMIQDLQPFFCLF